MSEQTPLMEQYGRIKSAHKDEVLLFRLGDFYEMFDSDAQEVSRLLNLTLTHRGSSPMCGIPHHASRGYIARLLRLGKKIAICEQVGSVAAAGGLTERKVIEVITPGTVVEDDYLERASNNFLASLCVTNGVAGFAYIDISTADFFATSWQASLMAENFAKELFRASPKELLLPVSLKDNDAVISASAQFPAMLVSYYPDWHFSCLSSFERLTRQFGTQNLASFSLEEDSAEVAAAGFLLDYIDKTTNSKIDHVKSIKVFRESEFVVMDDSTRRNLEILSNLRDGNSSFTLLETVNFTLTAMGNRTIREWLSSPLTDIKKIKARQAHVSFFFENDELLEFARDRLSKILDVERLASRISMEKAHAKDLLALAASLDSWISLREKLFACGFEAGDTETAEEISSLIWRAICDDPSTALNEGRIIREGYSAELDRYKEIERNFNEILSDYLDEEIEATGIANLRIKSNGAFGYFLEVTKGKVSSVPEHFIMKRALTNSERYTTERLRELERELIDASSNIVETEKNLFLELRARLAQFVPYLMSLAREIAYVDATASFAKAARVNRWIRPQVDDGMEFIVEGGRHPVVEKHLPSGEFVPNDLEIASGLERGEDEGVRLPAFSLITGPNMAGKSTFLRQNALIALLAQAGSFVPAAFAKIGIVDKIFCRVGASDNLSRGESTFLVEMTETARILRGATSRSLVIMDEVGRGTSTEDGLSIAWAVSEHLLDVVKCRTLFATHYHELTHLEHPLLKLLRMDMREEGGTIIFLRKVSEGAAGNSYGIHVAQLAGIPQSVILRASEILSWIQAQGFGNALSPDDAISYGDADSEKSNLHGESEFQGENSTGRKNPPQGKNPVSAIPPASNELFSEEEIILGEIRSADTDNMTPISALQLIARWKKTLSGN
ncbi:MAG: DNA mismatch repair protein MutS [Treponemataceae bacterium]|nr:DNA mismatch repair protein MutS [Treponemataceae bacterium]